MTQFKIGDVVWVQVEVVQVQGRRVQVVADGQTNKKDSAIKASTAILGWADVSDCKQDPQADLKQAIREVLLSDEFIEAFTKRAFGAKVEVALPTFTTLQNVSTERSLEHPIPGVNRPMRNDHPLSAGLVGAWVPNVSAEAPKTANCPETPDSSAPVLGSPWVGKKERPARGKTLPAEIEGVWIEPTPKPSKKQPPSGYRLLGDAKDEPRIAGCLYWSVSAKDWSPLLGYQVEYANCENWTACRKIKEPEQPWTPKIGENAIYVPDGSAWTITGEEKKTPNDGVTYILKRGRFKLRACLGELAPLKAKSPVGYYCDVESIWVDEPNPFEGRNEKNADKISVSGLVEGLSQAMQKDQDLAWTWHCNIAVGSLDEGVDHKTAHLAAARFMSIAFGVDVTTFEEWKRFDSYWAACRKIKTPSEPPKRYRDPTPEDLKNGPIDCEVGDKHEKRTLVYVFPHEPGRARFAAVDEASNCVGRWIDCRIEVTDDA